MEIINIILLSFFASSIIIIVSLMIWFIKINDKLTFLKQKIEETKDEHDLLIADLIILENKLKRRTKL